MFAAVTVYSSRAARALGVPLMASQTAIQPLVIGAEARTLAISRALFERGYWIAAIRPPTVPRGTARLRITLTAAHTRAQIDGLVETLAGAWHDARMSAASPATAKA